MYCIVVYSLVYYCFLICLYCAITLLHYLTGKTMDKVTMRELYEYYGVDNNTMSFTGHAMALERDDDYLERPADAAVEAIKLYAYSLQRYGKSPYIYPLYGLGGLPEGFSRLCAIHGGTFMLNRSVDEILVKDGKAWGIKCENEVSDDQDEIVWSTSTSTLHYDCFMMLLYRLPKLLLLLVILHISMTIRVVFLVKLYVLSVFWIIRSMAPRMLNLYKLLSLLLKSRVARMIFMYV